MKRVLFAALLMVSLVAAGGAATAQPSVGELMAGGSEPGSSDVPGVRALGDPPRGYLMLQYQDPTLLDVLAGSGGSWQPFERGTTVRQNELKIRGSAFGEVAGEYTIVTAFWQKERHNGTLRATDVTTYRTTIQVEDDELYSEATVELPSHLDETWQMTVWAERNGTKVDGVQWYGQHRSNPESAAVNVDSFSGLIAFSLWTAILPGIGGVIAGLVGSKLTLRRVGRGPGYGVGSWLFILAFVGFFVAILAYYQISVILYNIPYVMGASLGVVAYAAGLTFHQPVKKFGFFRREMTKADTMEGRPNVEELGEALEEDDAGAEIFDELTEAMYADLPQVPAVRTEDGYRVPVQGVKPFFARLFADAALLDLTSISTRLRIRKGELDELITVDPDNEEALVHKPARIVRVLPWDTLMRDYEDRDEEPPLIERTFAAITTAAILVVPATTGAMLLGQTVNLPLIGGMVGLVVTLVIAYSAEDGWIEFEAAPEHYSKAEDSLTVLQRAYKMAKEDQSAKEEARRERTRTAAEGRKDREEELRTATDELFEQMGMGSPADFEWGSEDDDA